MYVHGKLTNNINCATQIDTISQTGQDESNLEEKKACIHLKQYSFSELLYSTSEKINMIIANHGRVLYWLSIFHDMLLLLRMWDVLALKNGT